MKKIFLLLTILLFSASITFAQQNRLISGTVTSEEDGSALPGATVVVKGTTNGSITDVNGQYSISANSNDILLFSSISFEPTERSVDNNAIINVIMESSSVELEEVVAIGYGFVKKSDLTGSVTSIKTDKIQDIPTNSIGTLLQGRASGLRIINTSDNPEGGIGVRIRGVSSIKGSHEPLLVLDGIPFGSLSNLNQLSPADIESIEVLKDASAAAIYGSQGANGVILITTKKGKKGTAEVFVESSFTVAEYPVELDRYTDMVEMATIANQKSINDGAPPVFIGAYDNNFYYPSIEEFQNGDYQFYDYLPLTRNLNPLIYNVRSGIRGGTDMHNYSFSMNYFSQDGNIKGATYDKVNLLFNDVIKVTDKIKFSASVNMSNTENVNGDGGDYTNGGHPWIKPYNEDGSLNIPFPGYDHQLELKKDVYNINSGFDIMSMAQFTWNILPSLSYSSKISFNRLSTRSDYYQKSKYTLRTNDYAGLGRIYNPYNKQSYFINTLTFDKEFNTQHITVMLGTDDQVKQYGYTGIEGKDFVTDALRNENLTLAVPEDQKIFQSHQKQDLKSYFGRANYSLLNKYMITLTFRADGSSKFGADHKWGFFPAVALAWKIHNEDFIKNLDAIDVLKLRISAGKTGNQGINPYQSIERYGSAYFWDQEYFAVVSGSGPSQIANPELRWETTTQYNSALELGFFDNRLRFMTEVYYKHTTDLLRDKLLPPSGAFPSVLINDGVVDNWGIEFQVGGDAKAGEFKLGGDLMFSFNKNKVVDIGTSEDAGLITDENGLQFVFNGANRVYAIGQPINSFYGYVNEGIITTPEQAQLGYGNLTQDGRLYFKDGNDDGVIDEKDRVLLGTPNPDFTASLVLNVSYKKFYAEALFNAVYGNEIFDASREWRRKNRIDGWSLDNQNTIHPINAHAHWPANSYSIQSGSYLRFQNLSFGYNITVPNQKIFQRAKIYCNISNIFIWHNYDGYDPEVGYSSSSDVVTGESNDGWYSPEWPRQRRFTLGINMTF